MKIVLIIPLLLLPFIVGLPPASAATITVTNINDSGAGSLRQAIAGAAVIRQTTAAAGYSNNCTFSNNSAVTGGGGILNHFA